MAKITVKNGQNYCKKWPKFAQKIIKICSKKGSKFAQKKGRNLLKKMAKIDVKNHQNFM